MVILRIQLLFSIMKARVPIACSWNLDDMY